MDILGVPSPEFVHAYRALPSVVLEADMGRRKITWFRLARPLVVARAIIAYYLIEDADGDRRRTGLRAGAGRARHRPRRGRGHDLPGVPRRRPLPAQAGRDRLHSFVDRGGRRSIGVSYATSHSRHLQAWQFTHYFTADAITDALIFMAARRQRRTGPGRAVMNRCSVIQKRKKLQDPLRGGLHTSRGLPGPGIPALWVAWLILVRCR